MRLLCRISFPTDLAFAQDVQRWGQEVFRPFDKLRTGKLRTQLPVAWVRVGQLTF